MAGTTTSSGYFPDRYNRCTRDQLETLSTLTAAYVITHSASQSRVEKKHKIHAQQTKRHHSLWRQARIPPFHTPYYCDYILTIYKDMISF